jgi:hypothetical protein
MSNISIQNVVLGFIAAAIAVVTVHQAILFGLTAAGLAKAEPWSLKPMGPFGVPTLLNNMFWGGLWGAVFGAIWHWVPGNTMWIKGLVFGVLITIVSNWTLLPLIRGKLLGLPNQALFAGGDPQRMLVTLLVVGGFGAALGLIYGWIARST